MPHRKNTATDTPREQISFANFPSARFRVRREQRKRGNWFSLQPRGAVAMKEPLAKLTLIKFFTSDLRPTIFDFQSILRAREIVQPTAPARWITDNQHTWKICSPRYWTQEKRTQSASWRIPVIFRKGIQQLDSPSRRKSQTGLANFRPISHRVRCLEPK